MADREKVIKGLERCKLYNKVNCDKCPYDYNGRGNGKSECTAELAEDALALLKEQEKGEWIDHTFAHGDDIECPFCHKKWNVIDNCTETFDYCPGCGAKLS